MSMNETPSGDRLVIGLFGPRNAGKSSIINALTSQELAVTSPVAGTTTDPVRKAMELLPIGPVVLIDTAGLGDQGELGELRVKKTLEELRRCDLAVVVTDIGDGPDTEIEILEIMRKRGIPAVRALNFCDDGEPSEAVRREVEARSEIAPCYVSAITGYGIEELKQRIIEAAPKEEERNRFCRSDRQGRAERKAHPAPAAGDPGSPRHGRCLVRLPAGNFSGGPR